MRLGTRGSALALVQAEWVAAQLRSSGTACELVEITTAGDRGELVADKSRWVSALERALLEDRIDLAVHSAKDVPAELAEGLELFAITPREDPRDALCGAPSLDALPAGARIGTSSLRRAAQLRALRDDLEVVELHGNVDTRLRKLAAGAADAVVLALAGLRRLGREADADAVLDQLVPAAGQGALALEARSDDWRSGQVAGRVIDAVATRCVTAERDLTRALGASCQTAVGAHAEPAGKHDVRLRGWVGLPDGSEWIDDRLTGPHDRVGTEMAARMLAAGAGDLLRRAEREAPR